MSNKTVLAEAKKNTMAERIQKLVKPLSKIGQQKHLSALRDGFGFLSPITIAGAIAILFVTIVFGGWGAEQTSLLGLLAHASGNTKVVSSTLTTTTTTWELQGSFKEASAWGVQLFSWINAATLGSISIYVVVLIGYSMALVRRDKSPILAAIVSFGVFLIFTGANSNLYGANGMLVAIISGLVGSEFFTLLVRSKKLEIKLPPSVPPAVGRAFGVLLPAIVIFAAAASINLLVSIPYVVLGNESLTGLNGTQVGSLRTFSVIITDIIQQPFLSFAKSGGDVGLLELFLFGTTFLFFFGIHGPNTLNGIFTPIAILLWIDNIGGGQNVAIEQVWSGFIMFGGTGSTLPLVILSLVLLKRDSAQREVAKFALPAGIFEINEPVIFGFPIMFNFQYFFPYVFGPMLAAIWPVIAIKTGLMNAPTLSAPWTTPPFLYGLIVTQFDWRSIIVSILTFSTLTLVWFPFVIIQKRADAQKAKEEALKESPKPEAMKEGA